MSRGGCVWVMVVVWWLCVSHGGCVWVMVVVCGSWWLCVSMVVVCVSREVSKDAIIHVCQSTNDFRHPRLTLVQSAHRRTALP